MNVSMVSSAEPKLNQAKQKELSVRRRDVITGIRRKILKGAAAAEDMGKKHKKHKEYVEKPLKLVLKVGTGEVKELSTARAAALPQGFHEDKSDHEKHKDKKKKKKKKNEKVAAPGEEKKKKKDDKKKKDKTSHESDKNKDRTLHSPLGADIPAIAVPESSLAKPEENQTPLQEALNQLVRQLQRKDPSSFFAFPVTDFIAPGYSMIIKNPMDFSTMKEKIRSGEFESIEELKENFKQICHNAMIYNKPGTIYFKAAKKLLNSGMKILSQERIQSLKQSIEFMADLQGSGKDKGDLQGNPEVAEALAEHSMDTSDFKALRSPSKDLKRKDKEQQEDKQNDGNSEKDQELIDQIIKDSLGKLSKRSISSQFEFERRKTDGSTTLALLNPAETAFESGQGTAILGSSAGRLQSGVNSLQGFKEDKRNKVTPIAIMQWTREERSFCVEAYFSNAHSIIAVQRAFRLQFAVPPRGRVPGRQSIVNWVNAFRTAGNVSCVRRGPERRITTPQNIERVRAAVLQSPKRSARKQSFALGISRRSLHRILHDELNFHPYKMCVVQHLSAWDYLTRWTSCEDMLATIPRDAIVFFSDEAHFHLSGCVNKQNMRYWSEANPREVHERPLHSDRVTVWCAISRVGIIGPYFFQDNGRAITVNSERYLSMIQDYFQLALEAMELEDTWFQQDGATAHTARVTMNCLRQMFPGRLISLRGDVNWPARSPDLAPCDFFLWGYLKSKVYINRPNTLEDLRNNIEAEIGRIPVDMLVRVHENFRKHYLKPCNLKIPLLFSIIKI
ncbi:bromodomain-containing protein 7 isoform X2 [Ranitomeya imitator]|uniref:bromodomain-containing protein 7 isoform X2 n=1 Tax=Ranitomeya imitator TaxID=111125 RepID=UPI0037E78F52